MTFDASAYRGFKINVELGEGGKFWPTIHGPLDPRHAGDKWAKLPEAADESKDRAMAKAKDAIDKLVLTEMKRTVEQLAHAGVKVAS